MSKNRIIIISKGGPCPKCNLLMDRKTHKNISLVRTLYFFSEWDYCKSCRHVQLYEKFKIYRKQNV